MGNKVFCFLFLQVLVFLLVIVSVCYSSYLIPIPNPCVKVENISGNKVYLKSSEGVCIQKLSFISVDVEPDSKGDIEIYVDGVLWKRLKVKGGIEDLVKYANEISQAVSNSEEFQKMINSFNYDSPDKKKAYELAQKVYEYTRSKEYLEKENAFKKNFYSLFGGEKFVEKFKKEREEGTFYRYEDKAYLRLSSDERIYVFVSESVPIEVLRKYVSDSQNVEGEVIFVLRGGIEEGIKRLKKTAEWYMKLTMVDPTCDILNDTGCKFYQVKLYIDPFLFRRYGVAKVPAVCFVRGVERELDFSEGLPEYTKIGEAFISFGDVSFYEHLRKIGEVSKEKKLIDFAEFYLQY